LEDGKPQTVTVFETQKLAGDPLPPLPPEPAKEAPKPAEVKANVAKAQTINTAAPGKIQYQDKRLMVMFFDFSSMPPVDQVRAQKAALKFLNTQMTAS